MKWNGRIILAMLTRLYIGNFRCFESFNFEPGRKQLLIGPNGSGKSTILEVIQLLQEFVKGGNNPFTYESRTRWTPENSLQRFEIQALVDNSTYVYHVEIEHNLRTFGRVVKYERIVINNHVVCFEASNGIIRSRNNGEAEQIIEAEISSTSNLHHVTHLNSHVRQFQDWMQNLCVLKPDVYGESMGDTVDNPSKYLDTEFENFADWYSYYHDEDVAAISDIRNSLRDVLYGFKQLRFSNEGDEFKRTRRLVADFEFAKAPFLLSELSDGQRFLIGLYSTLYILIAKGKTVFFDEPDNFVSLREIQPWLQAAEDVVDEQRGQLILVSHHPEILNYWAQDYGLCFERKKDGSVVAKPFTDLNVTGLEPAETLARGWENNE